MAFLYEINDNSVDGVRTVDKIVKNMVCDKDWMIARFISTNDLVYAKRNRSKNQLLNAFQDFPFDFIFSVFIRCAVIYSTTQPIMMLEYGARLMFGLLML